MVRPIWFAVFRFMMNSNFVGCSTGKSGGLGALENLIDINRGALGQIVAVYAISHETVVFHPLAIWIYRWQPTLYREVYNLWSKRINHSTWQHKKRINAP